MAYKILITGTAGFVGFHLAESLLKEGYEIVGLDNINDYYDVNLKFARLAQSGIDQSEINWFQIVQSSVHKNYRFVRMNLEDKSELMELCASENVDVIINLAAQAGVRYSIENPDAYVQSNVVGFLNILEVSRRFKVKHLLYASSSSVYGLNKTMPFSVQDRVDQPVSLYAATKRSNELMAHTYSHLYKIPTTGLRFFTVYGPWGRPDMAYFLFADAIKEGKAIKVFNHGKLKRDFTYIDDIVNGIKNMVEKYLNGVPPSDEDTLYNIYNIGNNTPVELMEFITIVGDSMGMKPEMQMLDMQQGDVYATWADVTELIENFNYRPDTPLQIGISKFADWYKNYYKL
ncbi:NAD-dependent epimerase/dehydratase family protein [Pedobacter faecalis]|uniref:NAD-dependent epimerase/dehydratase family protein n=1 Tax=Pedobacter faecalis TaxID=3041495 RepID=UPI00254A76BF|nr:NAD-dependent epimerase/dehydratase family protein [Pedobacter sp. ELA7]